MEFDEISLVTRPANQLSKVVLFKGDNQMPESENTEVVEDLEDALEKGSDGEAAEEEEEEEEDEVEKQDLTAMLDYIDTLESANDELMAKLDGAEAGSSEELLKSADPAIVEIVKAAEDRAFAAEAIAKAEQDRRVEQEFIVKAAELGNLPISAESFGPVLKAAAENMTEEQFNALSKVLNAANEVIATGETFNEIGRSQSFDTDSGMGRIESAAKLLQKEDESMTREMAIAKAVTDDPSLYDSYLKESK